MEEIADLSVYIHYLLHILLASIKLILSYVSISKLEVLVPS